MFHIDWPEKVPQGSKTLLGCRNSAGRRICTQCKSRRARGYQETLSAQGLSGFYEEMSGRGESAVRRTDVPRVLGVVHLRVRPTRRELHSHDWAGRRQQVGRRRARHSGRQHAAAALRVVPVAAELAEVSQLCRYLLRDI